jgi:hypothetical protein
MYEGITMTACVTSSRLRAERRDYTPIKIKYKKKAAQLSTATDMQQQLLNMHIK